MEPVKSRNISIQIAIRNSANRHMKLYLEPWAEEFSMPFLSEFVVIGHGPATHSGFLIDYNDDSVTVTGWTGCTAQVFSNGEEIGNSQWRPPVPDFDSRNTAN